MIKCMDMERSFTFPATDIRASSLKVFVTNRAFMYGRLGINTLDNGTVVSPWKRQQKSYTNGDVYMGRWSKESVTWPITKV